MTTVEKFQKKAAKLRHDADDLYRQVDQEKDETRSKELCDQAKTMIDESLEWDERAEQAGRLAERKLDDARREFDGPKEIVRTTKRDGTLKDDFLSTEVNSDLIMKRAEIHARILSGGSASDEDFRSVSTMLPHERLWQRHLLTAGDAPLPSDKIQRLTDEEAEAYRAGVDAEAEAQLRFMGVGQATAGAQFVPTLVANRIVETMAYVGHMGKLDSGVMVTPTPAGGKIDVPQITDSHSQSAGQVNEGAATAAKDLTTSKVALAPEKRSWLYEISSEIIDANVVSFESRIVNLVGTFFGRAMNADLTNGNGTAPQSAGIATGTQVRTTTAKDAISEADVLGLYGMLDPEYEMDPTCSYQASKAIIAHLMTVKGTGDWRAFPLSMDRKLPILPGGMPLYYNNSLATAVAGNAGIDYIVLGCLMKYELAVSPFRAARDYDVTKDLHQLAFYMSWDGDFGDQRGFVRLENHA